MAMILSSLILCTNYTGLPELSRSRQLLGAPEDWNASVPGVRWSEARRSNDTVAYETTNKVIVAQNQN